MCLILEISLLLLFLPKSSWEEISKYPIWAPNGENHSTRVERWPQIEFAIIHPMLTFFQLHTLQLRWLIFTANLTGSLTIWGQTFGYVLNVFLENFRMIYSDCWLLHHTDSGPGLNESDEGVESSTVAPLLPDSGCHGMSHLTPAIAPFLLGWAIFPQNVSPNKPFLPSLGCSPVSPWMDAACGWTLGHSFPSYIFLQVSWHCSLPVLTLPLLPCYCYCCMTS